MPRRENDNSPRSTYTNQQKDEGRVRIQGLTMGSILIAAVLFDSAQALFFFLPLGIFFQLLLGLWFMRLGVNYFTGRRAAVKVFTLFFTLLLGFVPILNMLPEITLGAVVMIVVSRIEDTVGGHSQLLRIAKRRASGRQRILDRNKNRLDTKQQRLRNKPSAARSLGEEKRRGDRELAAYDRRLGRESFGMGARAVLGIKKRAVGERGGGKRKEEERSRAGFYDRDEAEEAVDMEEAKRQAVREWKRAYEERKRERERA